MHIVAIHSLSEDKESLAKALATVLGATIYEALARLRIPGRGPVTVAVFAEKERASGLLEKLETAGFRATMLTADEIDIEARASIVRRFSLCGSDLGITTDKADSLSVPFHEITCILRGTAIVHDVATETVKNRSISPGRAVLSGGMMFTKTTKDVREVMTEERQGFVTLSARDGSPLVFRENTLVYDSLGPALRPSRALNFTYLISELRRRCPDALYDERLLNRANQVALLGPTLNPEAHLSVATVLLRKVLVSGS
ncbi:MAG: hypothetical protein C0402_15485 [Thermodesulfovibrio sp.]|nr:hypothetical protein [Thermodesulfovibrio sp.]